MGLSEITSIRKLTDDEMIYEIKKIKKELFDIRFKKSTSQMYKSHEIQHLKHKLRQLLTLQHQTKKLITIV